MARILIVHPNRWGRGITAVWIPSHTSLLRSAGHEVELFDATFYRDWMISETAFNTVNQQYTPSSYEDQIVINEKNVPEALSDTIDSFQPDIIFWSAFSSHIHGEGEYVNIQYGYKLISQVQLHENCFLITGGLQATADPKHVFSNYPDINYLIQGESEFVLRDIADSLSTEKNINEIRGVVSLSEGIVNRNQPQEIIKDMDTIGPYDYSVFEDQVFFRPYNGNVVRAVDYELSRGCIYTCSYCVETVIQSYYGFNERNNKGTLVGATNYLRNKSAHRVYEELSFLNGNFGVELFRCQDTNFLTIDKSVLIELSELLREKPLSIKLYIETRPDGINASTIKLLSSLQVDGIGMGIELASEDFRETKLHRYSSRDVIIEAFKLLKSAGIKRTAYNIIGIPNETEEMILETIRFNSVLNPDNITVAFYSPYLGTAQQVEGVTISDFEDYEFDVDAQLRTLSKSSNIGKEMLEFYKSLFVSLARDGLGRLEEMKTEWLENHS